MVEGASCRRGPAMVGWPAMKPESALRLLHWAVLAFVLMGLGRAWAQDAHPLDLDQTRAALSLHRVGAQGQEPHRRRSPDPQGPERCARPRPSGGGRGSHAAARGVDEAPGGAHAQIGRDRAHDRRGGQGAREREKAARHARRQPARRPRHAAGEPTTSRPASARRGANCSRATHSPGRRASSIRSSGPPSGGKFRSTPR